MQPYVFPYIGYFHLIGSVDIFVFFDDANFNRKGWINRNRILMNGEPYMFSIPLAKASQNKRLNEIALSIDTIFTNRYYKQLEYCYGRAPYFDEVFHYIKSVFSFECNSVSEFAIRSIETVFQYLSLDFEYKLSSSCIPDYRKLERSDRLISICNELGCNEYVNAAGGRLLYDASYFNFYGIDLKFVRSKDIKYRQFGNEFVPNLSIIDVLMFNSKETVRKMLTDFELEN